MKKKIIAAIVVLAAIGGLLVYQALPAGAASPGVLDHVVVTPPSATVVAGGTVQFVAQGYDDGNLPLSGLTFAWAVVPATAGTVSTSGLYTAGSATGTFTVQVTVTQGTISKSGAAPVTVTATGTGSATLAPTANVGVAKLRGLLNSYLNSVGFENFLGGQWQVKNGTTINTVNATAGVVQTVTTSGFTMLANGQTTPTSFTLTSTTAILPKGSQLVANDKVVVITVNNQLDTVIKITPPATKSGGDEPPGLKDNEHAKPNATTTPSGWSQGKKTGWGGDQAQGAKHSKD